MYKKETTDKKYHENPYRAVNFAKDADGNLLCPKRSKIPLQEKVFNRLGKTHDHGASTPSHIRI